MSRVSTEFEPGLRPPVVLEESRRQPSSLDIWPAAGGGVLLGIVVRSLAGRAPARSAVKTAFLRIDSAGLVTLLIPYVWMEGEAALCAADLAGMELGISSASIVIDPCMSNRNSEGAPRPRVIDLGPEAECAITTLAASARRLLTAAAVDLWSVSPAACRIEQGAIREVLGGRSLTFAQLAQDAAYQSLSPLSCY
jgi:isoquinoline 1-oxidoreductase beta subunit